MKGRIFVDTNILIYAHDLDAGPRHDIAASDVEELWENRIPICKKRIVRRAFP